MAIEILESVKNFQIRHRPDQALLLRIGIHTGKRFCQHRRVNICISITARG